MVAERGAGQHVRRAGADAGGDRPGLQPVLLPRVGDARCAPWPARCGPGRRAGGGRCLRAGVDLGLQQRLARGPRRCRGRRCRSSRRRTCVRSPSRSTYWLPRNRMVACATVSRTVASASASSRSLRCGGNHGQAPRATGEWQSRVDGLVVPGAAQPGVVGVVDDLPGASRRRAGHHVEVVQVVAGRGHRGAVVAVRHQHDVTGAHLFEHLDRAGPGAARPGGSRSRGSCPRSGGDLEVVDLLELGLGSGCSRRACAGGSSTSCRRG